MLYTGWENGEKLGHKTGKLCMWFMWSVSVHNLTMLVLVYSIWDAVNVVVVVVVVGWFVENAFRFDVYKNDDGYVGRCSNFSCVV